MFQSNIQFPQLQQWQTRFTRVPRWAWIALFVGVLLPIAVLSIGLIAVALVSAFVILGVVGLVVFIRHKIRSLLRPVDDGRRNVKIVVHSARVIDP